MANSQSTTSPTIQHIPFHEDELYAIVDERTGKEYVLPRPMADMFGLDWSGQLKKLNRNQLFRKGMVKMSIPSAGGEQEAVLLERRLVHAWLFSIDINRVATEYQAKLLRYQEECAQVLDAYFSKGIATNHRMPPPRETLDTLHACQTALKELGCFDDRDAITFGAYIRRVAAHAMDPLSSAGSPGTADMMQPLLWTMSMRLQYLKYPVLSGVEGESQQIKIGSLAAKSYRATYKEEPKKIWDFVKGQQRQVNGYLPERLEVLDSAIYAILGAPRLQVVAP